MNLDSKESAAIPDAMRAPAVLIYPRINFYLASVT
jgi:hypothetical protein